MSDRGRDNQARAGMTLIECAISIAVVAIMLVAALSAMGSFARARQSQFDRCVGSGLARALVTEILQARYLEPDQNVYFGREPGESANNRSDWDDVDDYNGMNECPPKSKAGAAIVGADGWRRAVSVAYVQPDNPNVVAAEDTGLVRITVTVTSPKGVATQLSALRGDQSIYDQPPDQDGTFVTWVGAEMQIGPDPTKRLTTGANVLNRQATEE